MSHRSAAAAKLKLDLHRQGACSCAVCGWIPPAVDFQAYRMLCSHHVIPVSVGGIDGPKVVLCPNHHAVAHAAWRIHRGRWFGPRTPDELVHELREIDADVAAWNDKQVALVTALLAQPLPE